MSTPAVKVQLDLPAGVSQRVIALAGRQALEAAVLALWREGELSTRQAASELSLTYRGFLDLLADKGLPVEDGLFDAQSVEAAGAQVRDQR